MVGEALRSREAAGGRFFDQSGLESRCVWAFGAESRQKKAIEDKNKITGLRRRLFLEGGINRRKLCQKERRKIALDLGRLE